MATMRVGSGFACELRYVGPILEGFLEQQEVTV